MFAGVLKGIVLASVLCGAAAIPKYEIITKPKPSEEDDYGRPASTNTLVFPSLSASVALDDTSNELFGIALDDQSIKIQWLCPNRVLWVSWRTVPLGSGAYVDETHVLLLVEGGKAKEILNERFQVHGAGGLGTESHYTCSFSYVAAKKEITFRVIPEELTLTPQASSLTKPYAGDMHELRLKYIETVTYPLLKNGLGKPEVTTCIDLGERAVKVDDLVDLFIGAHLPLYRDPPEDGLFKSADRPGIANELGLTGKQEVSGRVYLPKTNRRIFPPITRGDR